MLPRNVVTPPPPDAPEQVPPTGVVDCPILCWILSLNREYTKEEYDLCYQLVQECVPHIRVDYKPSEADGFRMLLCQMLPLLMMRHRRIPRHKWRDNTSSNGKHWIEQLPEEVASDKYMFSHIGYQLHYENSICGMAMVQGVQRKVINIGIGIKQLSVEPRGVSVSTFTESMSHKLSHRELHMIKADPSDDAILRRLCTVLALKDAYIRAVGQPLGFDYSRLDFDVPNGTAQGDNIPLQGWEFRLWNSNLGVARRDKLVNEKYICAIAFFRGDKESKFIWYESTKELETWVQYINIDQIIKVAPKLNA